MFQLKKYMVYGFCAALLLWGSMQAKAQNTTPVETFNYAKIAKHPRLLLSSEDEVVLKKAIGAVPEFKKIDTFIIESADKFISQEPLVFEKKGKRLLAVSRKAFTRLYYWSYSYRLTKDKKYLDRAEKEMLTLCAFQSWNPSHFLDTGEMCMGLAIAYDWLYADLQESTKQIVRKAIVEKAFKPSYIKENNFFVGSSGNWNSVCNAGLVFGALAIMEDEKSECVPIIERAMKSNLLPLSAYAPDGNYPEGPGYWNYGTSFQVMLIAALESALGSDNGLSKSPGFMKTADYMLFSAGNSGSFFNYSDCGEKQVASATLFWFANKTKNSSLIFKEMELINAGFYTLAENSDSERILPNALIFGKNLDFSKTILPTQKTFVGHGKIPVAIVRTDWKGTNGHYLGIKGGGADAGHSHLDQGTFVYDVNGLRWAMDLGLQSYITLESKGVDIWGSLEEKGAEKWQEAERWDVFKYNNFNHNTISINNKKHNVKGKATIIESYEKGKELGAKVDLASVLNFNNELKLATRKAVIVEESYLKIEDIVETNANPVDLRWNMVTAATTKIVDKNTIKLSQKGKVMLLKFNSNIPFTLVLRPSEDPSKIKAEFKEGNYGDYNQLNKGTSMLGFDCQIPANTKANFTVTFTEQKQELKLKPNTIVLDATDPNTASEGDTKYFDVSPIEITQTGDVVAADTPDWNPYGKITASKALGKTIKFRIDAKRITDKGIEEAGIDRSNNGQLGIRGGQNNGIEKNEGFLLGLDLSEMDSSTTFKLTKIGFALLDTKESCVIINRKSQNKMLVYKGSDTDLVQDVKITSDRQVKMVDVSSLGITLNGGLNHQDFLSLFNTGESDSTFRITGFELEVK
jgi:hypothetical protein